MSVAEASRVEAAWRTDTGRLRSLNEDAVLCFPERGLFAVIDGVGGEAGGDVGAREAAAVLLRRLSRDDGSPTPHRIREAIALANNRLLELAQRDPRLAGMSCVLTVALVEGTRLTIGHIGDTRLYRLRRTGGELPEAQKLTRDHSPVGQMEELGEISESEAMRHPRRNEIYRDVGSTWHRPDDEDFVEIFEDELLPGDSLLICSDGLTDQVPLRDIRRLVGAHEGDPGTAIDLLIERSNAAGGKDNVSIVLVEAAHSAPAPAGDGHGTLTAAGTAASGSTPRGRIGTLASSRRSGAFLRPGAGSAKARRVSKKWLVGGAATALLAALATWVFWLGPDEARTRLGGLSPGDLSWTAVKGFFAIGPAELRVGQDQTYSSIQAALAVARSGQTITVGPGVYEERLQLRNGVHIEVLPPRSATLRVPPQLDGSPSVGVWAVAIRGATLSGLRIEPQSVASLDVGVQLTSSEIEIRDVLVQGAASSAVEILGRDRSTLELMTLESEATRLVRFAGDGRTQFRENILDRSGAASGLPPIIEIEGAAAPVLIGNQIRGSGTAVLLSSAERAKEIELRNTFKAAGNKPPKVSIKAQTVSSSGSSFF